MGLDFRTRFVYVLRSCTPILWWRAGNHAHGGTRSGYVYLHEMPPATLLSSNADGFCFQLLLDISKLSGVQERIIERPTDYYEVPRTKSCSLNIFGEWAVLYLQVDVIRKAAALYSISATCREPFTPV